MRKKKPRKEDLSVSGILLSEVFKVLNKHPNQTFNYKQLIRQLKPAFILHLKNSGEKEPDNENLNAVLKNEIQNILSKLVLKDEVIEVDRGKYKLKPKHAYLDGIIDITSSGAAYLLSENDEDDIFISPKNVKNALHGDRVRLYLYARHKNQRLEGAVTEVLERAKREFVGTVQMMGNNAFVIPDSPKMLVDIFIPQHDTNKASHGQKVIAEISDWKAGTKNPIGRITKLLGWPGENDVEMNSILSEYGFPLEFPPRVEGESEKIKDVITKEEIGRRRDFRTVTTFTIDPFDAKDFDDALSVKQINDNFWEIGVHIADVSYYVLEKTALDKEAYERGTSVYLVDRVIPMLPEKLSNGVCSLRPNEDKLCFSAVFEIDDTGMVHKSWFGKTIIHSDKRFSYEEAQEIIEKKEGEYKNELLLLDGLAKKLRAERFRKGAVAFEKMEVKFELDDKGKPIGVYLKESKDSNKLIEEFMLLANRSVAEFIGKNSPVNKDGRKNKSDSDKRISIKRRPFVYRIHEGPVSEKLLSFARFAGKWGYKISTEGDREIANSLNSLLKNLHGKKEQNVLEQLAIRTMSKAIYSTENVGHYGLAFDHYTHFTSPIRRFPDILVHRLLENYLNGNTNVDADLLQDQCKHSTMMEIRASEAERASIKYKQVEFLKDRVGQIFDGIVSGVTEWGLYVEIVENKCEGMVRLRDLDDDFYEFDDSNYCVIGSRTKKKYTLGDTVKVEVVRCDLLRKQIDFRMISEQVPGSPSTKNAGRTQRQDGPLMKRKFRKNR